MIPVRREALAFLLDDAKQAVRRRSARFAAAPDAALVRLTGFANPALCRRLVDTPRIARRLEPRLDSAIEAERRRAEAEIAQARLAELQAAEAALAAPALAENPGGGGAEPAAISYDGLLAAIAAAIRLSTSGALITAAEIADLSSRFGEAAVNSGLKSRTLVPAWMRAVAGDRQDVVLQLAATAIACWDHGTDVYAAFSATHDPLPIDDPATRKQAAQLAGATHDHLMTDRHDASDRTGPET